MRVSIRPARHHRLPRGLRDAQPRWRHALHRRIDALRARLAPHPLVRCHAHLRRRATRRAGACSPPARRPIVRLRPPHRARAPWPSRAAHSLRGPCACGALKPPQCVRPRPPPHRARAPRPPPGPRNSLRGPCACRALKPPPTPLRWTRITKLVRGKIRLASRRGAMAAAASRLIITPTLIIPSLISGCSQKRGGQKRGEGRIISVCAERAEGRRLSTRQGPQRAVERGRSTARLPNYLLTSTGIRDRSQRPHQLPSCRETCFVIGSSQDEHVDVIRMCMDQIAIHGACPEESLLLVSSLCNNGLYVPYVRPAAA